MSQGGFGVSADRRICSLDAHPLHVGVLVVGYDDGNLDWRKVENADFMKVGATDGSKAEIVRWAPKESLTVACVFGDRASVFDHTGNAWRSFILRGHASDVLSISWSSDGMKLATSSVDNKIIYWDYLRGAQLQVISASGWITSCAIDPASRYIAGCVEDKLMVWRIADGIEHFSARVNRRVGGKAKCVEWSPDGKNVCCGSSDGSVNLFDRQNESPPVSFDGFGTEPISRVRFCPSVGRDPHSLGSSPTSYLCVCSKSNIVIFSSQDAEALDNWFVRECDDISWTPRGEVVYSARGEEPFAVRKPTALANLEFISARQLLESVAGGHSMRGNDAAKPGGDAFVESVVQMETEELGKEIALKQQQTVSQQQVASQGAGASNQASQQQQQQQSVTMTKGGKKRIQPINASTAAPAVPSLNGPASSSSSAAQAPPQSNGTSSLAPPPPPPPPPAKLDGASLPPPPPPPPPSSAMDIVPNGTSSTTTTTTTTTTTPKASTSTHNVTTSSIMNNNSPQVDPGDCGKCKNCLDKPKFGGRNVLKQRCIHRPPMAKRARTGLPQVSTSTSDANSKNHLLFGDEVDDEVGIGGAESEEDDGWSSSELEPDSDNEYSAFVLSPLRMPEFYESANVVRSLSRERQLRMETRLFNRMDLSLFESGERRWTTTVRGVVAALVHSQEFICCATSARELHVFEAASGVIIGPPIALSCACAYLELLSLPGNEKQQEGEESILVFCTKDGNANMLNLNTDDMLIAQAPLSPLLTLRGKPFSLSSSSTSSSSSSFSTSAYHSKPKLCSLHVMQNRTLVLLVSDRSEISCAAFAYQPKHKSWTKILDPMRFIGSEFIQIYPSNPKYYGGGPGRAITTTTTPQSELASLQQKLIWGLASTSSASMAASLLGETGTVSLQITVAHVESMIHASRAVESTIEQREWLQILFDRLARDFQGFHRKAKQWLLLLNDKLALDKHFINQNLLPRLAKNRDYQNLVEFWMERSF